MNRFGARAPRSEAEPREAIGPRMGGADVTEIRLEAPHRRIQPGHRFLERTTVLAYRSTTWLVSHVPPALPRAIIAAAAQLSYLL